MSFRPPASPAFVVIPVNCSYSWCVKLSPFRDEVLPKTSSFRDDESSSWKWKWPETDDASSMDDSDDFSEEDDIFYDSETVVEPVPQQQKQPQIPEEEYVIYTIQLVGLKRGMP